MMTMMKTFQFVMLALCVCTALARVAPARLVDDCTEGTVFCFVAPCRFATCAKYPNAVCRDDYCGGCFARFYVSNTLVTDCSITAK